MVFETLELRFPSSLPNFNADSQSFGRIDISKEVYWASTITTRFSSNQQIEVANVDIETAKTLRNLSDSGNLRFKVRIRNARVAAVFEQREFDTTTAERAGEVGLRVAGLLAGSLILDAIGVDPNAMGVDPSWIEAKRQKKLISIDSLQIDPGSIDSFSLSDQDGRIVWESK